MNRKLKVVLFTDSLGAGGAQRQLVGLASMLEQEGYEVLVLTYFPQDFYKSYLDDREIRNICLTEARDHIRRIPILFSYIRHLKPDVIVAYQETPSLIASLIKALGIRFRLIVSERNTTQSIGINERFRFFLYHWADAIIPNSYTQTNFLANRYGWMKAKLKTIINFVDLDTYCVTPHTLREIPVITVAASIWPPKNTIGMLEACKILNDRGVKYKLEWYGLVDQCGSYAEECFALIKRYNLTNVKLLPKIEQIVVKYQQTDFFCLPSFYEGTANVICEAVACGKPILSSNICDNGKYVIENVNGFLFDPNNPEEMACKICEALQINQKDYERMCKNSRKIAEMNFNKDRFIREYIRIIQDI